MNAFARQILILAACLLGAAAWAQDPPGRVGRLAYTENEVTFHVDRNDRGQQAAINWPISSGAIIETGRRSRAESWIGSSAFRLADSSRLEFSVVDDRRIDLRLEGGSLAISVLDRDQAADMLIATPDGLIRLATSGRYRIDVDAESTELSVQAGRASIEGGGRTRQVEAGQEIALWNDGHERSGPGRDQDAFDLWVGERENATLAGPARQYVSPQMTGYADLDAWGDWRTTPEYGAVWYPRSVASDWAPYRQGRWEWIAPWGWTWIDQAPWGFAPFHYGRWALFGGRWAWIPGRPIARPVYSPALVGWVGNNHWNVGFSFGSAPAVGWFPLGPREVYVPSYRYSATYIRQVNVSHISESRHIDLAIREGNHRHFEYYAQPRAITAVPAERMREGMPITGDHFAIPHRGEIERAPRGQQASIQAPSRPFAGTAVQSQENPTISRSTANTEGFSRSPLDARRDFGDYRQNQPQRRVESRDSAPANNGWNNERSRFERRFDPREPGTTSAPTPSISPSPVTPERSRFERQFDRRENTTPPPATNPTAGIPNRNRIESGQVSQPSPSPTPNTVPNAIPQEANRWERRFGHQESQPTPPATPAATTAIPMPANNERSRFDTRSEPREIRPATVMPSQPAPAPVPSQPVAPPQAARPSQPADNFPRGGFFERQRSEQRSPEPAVRMPDPPRPTPQPQMQPSMPAQPVMREAPRPQAPQPAPRPEAPRRDDGQRDEKRNWIH